MFIKGQKMRKISLLLLCALVCSPVFANDYDDEYDDYNTSTQQTVHTDNRDTYTGIRIHRNEHIVYKNEIGGHSKKIRDDNYGIGLNVGNRLTDNVKIEFETMYTGTSAKKYSTDFDYDVWSNMLNVYLFQNYGGAVEPYVGIGIGFSDIWGDIGGKSDSNFDLSFAVMTGVNFALNKYVDLNLGIRYVEYGKLKQDTVTTRVDATEIYIGAAYKFSIFK